ncbi:amino acid ABC transporter permease [Candidatus Poriferisodalis sp.]|uniref:amino acid ABC transporter permease n=1 Tax=Candidatus Poriferisodalis sp. TaxID=3101277 RepID=UPI003B5163E9
MSDPRAPARDDSLATLGSRPPFYRDATVVRWIAQVGTLILVVAAMWFLATEAGDSLRARGANIDFDFISDHIGIKVGWGIDTNPDSGGRALWVGMVNTIRMAAAGIALASVVGVLVGLARLSSNWPLRRLAGVYVETLRNIPLLVQILVYAAVLATLPNVTFGMGPIPGWVHLSNKGLSIPRVFVADGFYQWAVILVIGAVIAHFVFRRLATKRDMTGAQTNAGAWATGIVAAFAIVGWWVHPIFGWLGNIVGGLADAVGAIPQGVVQLVAAVAAIAVAVWWIRRFLARRRTPAGLTRLTDDDWFRMIFAVVAAAIVVFVVAVLWPGLSSWVVNSSSDGLGVLADKFGNGRTGPPIDALRPDIVQPGNFANYGPAGLNLPIGFAAVYFGVVFYTAAFIAEIVRGGILAVPKGQSEAAQALGLRRSTSLRRVILPQALRVILPPVGNQYLNLTKNTSLAIAVGYSDLVQIGQTVYNQTGKTLQVMAVWMLFYLACSLTISAVVNFFNIRLRIVER